MTSAGPGTPVRRLLVVEHDPDAPAGLMAGWACGRGLAVGTVQLHAGQPLPDQAAACDAAVLLGSEQTAYDDTVPWLAAELAFTERLLAADVPVLGICFGGQVLARVLGARLYRLSEPEIGWVRVTSKHHDLAEGPWPSWHVDGFDLPPGAAGLATNEVCLQAFTLGPHVGVQFHPEATRPIVASWLANSDPRPARELTGSLIDGGDAPWQEASVNAEIFFSAWLDGGLLMQRQVGDLGAEPAAGTRA